VPSALVLGASRGIGLEFVRQYLAEGWTVYGTHRSEADGITLRDLGARTLRLDVLDVDDVAGIGSQLGGERLDVALVNAGVYGPRTSNVRHPPSDAEFDLVMHTNVLAAMRLLPVVTPLLGPARGTLALVSSRMGSISEAGASNGMLYRVSKAAVNMVAKLAHVEHAGQGVRVLALHPGWVRTDMGGASADVEVGASVQGMRRVIADPRAFPGGGFFDYRGQSLAW
jgi:NAD(P)-dependent dehydrogenase (short-subunit alcohol dehydrogenase family)